MIPDPLERVTMKDFVRPAEKLRALERKEPAVFTWKLAVFVAVMALMYFLAWVNQ